MKKAIYGLLFTTLALIIILFAISIFGQDEVYVPGTYDILPDTTEQQEALVIEEAASQGNLFVNKDLIDNNLVIDAETDVDNICYSQETDNASRIMCLENTDCFFNLMKLVDPRDGTTYEKNGCDTRDNWEKFQESAPSFQELQKFECRNQSGKESCESLEYCTYDDELSFCFDTERDISSANTPAWEATPEGVDCPALDPSSCMEVGCAVVLPDSEDARCENI